jgi:N-acetylneuraminate synthase
VIVEESRNIAKALGIYPRVINQAEEEKKLKFRRSVVADKDLGKGHSLTIEDLVFKRPGSGIRPDEANYLIGRTLKQDIVRDELLRWDVLD